MNHPKILNSKILEEIERLYHKEKLSLKEVAKKTGISVYLIRHNISNIRKSGDSHALNCERNSVALTYEQRQLILGSLLGDSSIYHSKQGTDIFQVSHCLKQKEYLEYKANLLKSPIFTMIGGKNSFSEGKVFYKTYYSNKYQLKDIRKLVCLNGKKTVTKEWLDQVDIGGISYWFFDDGWSYYRKDGAGGVTTNFATNCFSRNEIELMQNKLLEFNIQTSINHASNNKGLILYIKNCSNNNFMDLIEPYAVDCMKYKIKRRK